MESCVVLVVEVMQCLAVGVDMSGVGWCLVSEG